MDPVQNMLVTAMQNSGFYPHPADRVELVETHISWVFLAGDFAYKLKKPLDFGFLDFSTLERRRHFCHEELRLNQRFAPQLYLEVVSIGGCPEHPRLNGEPVLDYAVRMKRFPACRQLDRMQAAGRLTATQVDRFATLIAQLHAQAPVAGPGREFGCPESIIAPIRQNFTQLKTLLPDSMRDRLAELEAWSRTASRQLAGILRQRKERGFIRECHGDVHLGNMAWFEDQPLLFDCIEFNENLRWIDLINDIAFLVMDLDDRGEERFGWQFLNRYLRQSGDYRGLQLLAFYKVYRAMVRAKVFSLRLSQEDLAAAERAEDERLVQSYLDLAAGYTKPPRPALIITHGLSGAGKTTIVEQLAPCCRAICLHSDVERKRRHHLELTAASDSPVAAGLYTDKSSAETYRNLRDLAESLLGSGLNTIIDATFIRQQSRTLMRQLAEKLRAPLLILDFQIAAHDLERRIRQRSLQAGQISEATLDVLHFQQSRSEPLDREELKSSIPITSDMSVAEIAKRIAGRLRERGTAEDSGPD